MATVLARRSAQRCLRDGFRVALCAVSVLRASLIKSYASSSTPLGGAGASALGRRSPYLPHDSQILRAMALAMCVQALLIMWRFTFITTWPQLRSMFVRKERRRTSSWDAYRGEAHPLASTILSTVAACVVDSIPHSLSPAVATAAVSSIAVSTSTLLVVAAFVGAMLCAIVLCALAACCVSARNSGRSSVVYRGCATIAVGAVVLVALAWGRTVAPAGGDEILELARGIWSSMQIHTSFSRLHSGLSSGCRSLVLFVLSDGLVSGLRP